MKPVKAYLDIETFPWLAYLYGKHYEPIIVQELEPMKILSIAYAFDDGPVKCKAFFDFSHGKGVDDKPLLKFIAKEIISKADIIIGHNVVNFDLKVIRDRMITHGMKPFPKPMTYDTLVLAGKYALTPSKKQGYLLERYGEKGKVTHEGMKMFMRAGLGDKKSQKVLKEYNKGDVEGNRILYKKYQVWEETISPVWESIYRCPKCQGTHTTKHKKRWAGGEQYRQRQCQDCGHHFKAEKVIAKI